MSAQPSNQAVDFHDQPLVPKTPMNAVYSEADYLAFDEAAEGRWEFMDGRIIPHGEPERANQLDPQFRAGTSVAHYKLQRMLNGLLFNRLRNGCEAYTGDARTFMPVTKNYCYPDLVVVCGDSEYNDPNAKLPSLTNPVLIVEILSASTEHYDRSGKLMRYLSIDSLQQYLMIDSRQMQAELYSRLPAGTWEYWAGRQPEQVIDLKSVGCQLTLAELYAGIVLEPLAAAPADAPA